MRAWALLAVLALCLCLAVGVGGATVLSTDSVESSDAVDSDRTPLGASPQEPEVDQVVMEIHLEPDGSAAWRIEHRIRLDDEAKRDGFEEIQSQVETEPDVVLDGFSDRVEAMATTAGEQTGRVMVVENFSVAAHREQLPQEYGTVAYEFHWYGFAATDEQLRAGDALDGLFLDDETTMIVSWPANTTLAEVAPDPDDRRDRAVVWDGPLEFASDEPTVVLESETLSFGPDLVWDVSSNDVFVTLAAVALLVSLVGTGGFTLRRRLSDGEDSGDTEPSDPSTTDAEAGDGPQEATSGREEDDSQPPETLLSNEERVLALLEERGGRIKQQDIVEALEWSETKTSEVVSDLREADRIEVYRLGRNNVLALPETGLGYEFDDEGGENG